MSTPQNPTEAQNWTKALYIELAEKITNAIAAIKWVDLWHNQVGFLEDEHPFPTPALFLSFRSNNIRDLSQKVQQVILQIDFICIMRLLRILIKVLLIRVRL